MSAPTSTRKLPSNPSSIQANPSLTYHPPPANTINNLAASNKPTTTVTADNKPKPCCVCKDEKSARDECMLFSTAKDPQEACADLVTKYKSCMKGFGFDLA